MKTELGKMKFDLYESKNDAYKNGVEDGFDRGFWFGMVFCGIISLLISIII